jgi:hypothetical protein
VKNLIALATVSLVLLGAMVTMVSAKAGAPAAEFVLSGLVAFDNGEGVAWLQEPSLTQNKVVKLRRGDSVGPWKVTRILENRVELEGPAGKVLVPFGTTVGSGAPAAPSPVATAGGSSPSPAGTISIPVGDPRRREGIANLFGMLHSGIEARPQSTAGAQVPNLAVPPASRPSGQPKTISFPVGDPRRREAIRKLFGQ